jgi:YD repeat-containing protein
VETQGDVSTFNDANEMTQIQRTVRGGTPTTLTFTYDKQGNLREQQLASNRKMRYTHDAWNRLSIPGVGRCWKNRSTRRGVQVMRQTK